nr:hypothetical protein Iba_chr12aCG8190 [Ipomoea batatas]
MGMPFSLKLRKPHCLDFKQNTRAARSERGSSARGNEGRGRRGKVKRGKVIRAMSPLSRTLVLVRGKCEQTSNSHDGDGELCSGLGCLICVARCCVDVDGVSMIEAELWKETLVVFLMCYQETRQRSSNHLHSGKELRTKEKEFENPVDVNRDVPPSIKENDKEPKARLPDLLINKRKLEELSIVTMSDERSVILLNKISKRVQ